MSSKMKQWVTLTVVGVLAVLAAGWFLLVSPKRDEATQVRADVAAQQSTNSGLQTQLAMLKAQAKTLPQQQAKLALVAAKIPDNPALPSLIRALSDAASDAGVELVSMAPGTPAPVAAAPGAAPAAPAATGSTTSTPATTGSTAAKPTTLTGTSTAPAASAGVLTSIPLTINVVGGYFQIEQFFDKLEELTRAAKVTAFTMAPGANPLKRQSSGANSQVESGKVLTANLTANVYMAVGRGLTATASAPLK